jgi:hypothetical protein
LPSQFVSRRLQRGIGATLPLCRSQIRQPRSKPNLVDPLFEQRHWRRVRRNLRRQRSTGCKECMARFAPFGRRAALIKLSLRRIDATSLGRLRGKPGHSAISAVCPDCPRKRTSDLRINEYTPCCVACAVRTRNLGSVDSGSARFPAPVGTALRCARSESRMVVRAHPTASRRLATSRRKIGVLRRGNQQCDATQIAPG